MSNCGCNGPGQIQSWIDILNTPPQNPQDLIAYATLGGTVGTYLNSTDFSTAGAWTAVASGLNGSPSVSANGTDNLQMVADADQWNFQHLTRSPSFSTLTPPMQKVVFLRGGLAWKNTIPLSFGASATDVQLSFRDNAGTRGDFAGTIPVIRWASAGSTDTLVVTLKSYGRVSMGLRVVAGGNTSMYEMEWVIVP